ncbi:hypothetical protein pdul_cds_159 [Pandoravirus dulcis]|uniref:Uncharacterized protein n=1 Tax=Pandoravirus dulcis TaxID=1349409 RepID=S4VVV7_9VIRU|nr:hypothetical protein pdul_cds_159 [Pandoravirus dulcis]AGO82079.1 hypothetical protein pdul_cds_159 [Pandoravirus dulcis]
MCSTDDQADTILHATDMSGQRRGLSGDQQTRFERVRAEATRQTSHRPDHCTAWGDARGPASAYKAPPCGIDRWRFSHLIALALVVMWVRMCVPVTATAGAGTCPVPTLLGDATHDEAACLCQCGADGPTAPGTWTRSHANGPVCLCACATPMPMPPAPPARGFFTNLMKAFTCQDLLCRYWSFQ